jgi:UDP-N-acetylglucosamine:LPS N-acetylglucosamine transferase
MARILIFVSKTGGGHISLGEALRDQMAGQHQVELLDPQPAPIHWHYRLVSRHALWLWAAEFKTSDTPARAMAAHRVYNLLLARRVASVLQQLQPDLVISTYPFLTTEVTAAMRIAGMHVPFALQYSDPNGVHASWLSDREAQAFLAPTEETYRQALDASLPPERTHLTGWPVRLQFSQQPAEIRPAVRRRLDLQPDCFTVFLQGGGEGAAKFVKTVENLLVVPDIQVILAAGTNRALLQRFAGQERIRPIPFTREIAPFMAAADVVMGKAGPNMLFESITLGRPFIATTFIPGQEEVNLEFIKRHGLGWIALDAAEQRRLVSVLPHAPAELQGKLASVSAYAAWNSSHAAQITPVLQSLLKN